MTENAELNRMSTCMFLVRHEDHTGWQWHPTENMV